MQHLIMNTKYSLSKQGPASMETRAVTGGFVTGSACASTLPVVSVLAACSVELLLPWRDACCSGDLSGV